jgi:hypothetical protein
MGKSVLLAQLGIALGRPVHHTLSAPPPAATPRLMQAYAIGR